VTALLSTKGAAAYLRVSEASVRRWSDAGLLGVRRVGRRRARRFAEADLRRFKAGDPKEVDLDAQLTDSPPGIGGARLGIHDHFATFYSSDAGRLRVSLPFLRDGLLAGQPCFLVASPTLRDEYFEALRGEGDVDLQAAIESGALVTLTGVGTSAGEAVTAWEEKLWRAVSRGAVAIRVVGEMATYDGFPSTRHMLDYEVAYDSLSRRLPLMTLCQYDVRKFDGPTIMGALQAHPDLYARRIADFLL
jgi:transcriptional repressor of dcmA and dcmR